MRKINSKQISLLKISLLLIFTILFNVKSKVWAQNNPNSGKFSYGSVLPFPKEPLTSITAETIAKSKLVHPSVKNHLPKNAPNIVVILMDDVGFATASTFGGEINTPTLSKVYKEGIAYNEFHTTAQCSPTRAALLTGRNHTRVGSGNIPENAVDFDGYIGNIPKEAATFAEVLKNYGYSTSAFGKWHNTPSSHISSQGPFNYWPNNFGFEYFYGFIGGETSQFEPRLVENFNQIEPPRNEKYHFGEDMADHAVSWLHQHQSFAASKPFLLYFAPGAGHGPHHIFKEWADKYKGKFDDGWDAYRERVFNRQKEMGWIPANAELTARDSTMASWASIPANEKPFQSRLMEVFAGFVEHSDAQIGKVLDAIDLIGQKDNTIIFFIWGDNGSSAEGRNGTISEFLAQNQISTTIPQQMEVLQKLGGMDVLGSSLTYNMYHAAWAWAGNTPFKYTKLVASHFGGTRNPLVISWPKNIRHDSIPRSQFHHVNDIAPTIYDILGIKGPKLVNGFAQMPFDGVSMKYTFANAKVPAVDKTQFFELNGSRGIYKDGWFASAFGFIRPWITGQKGINEWNSEKDKWELYDLRNDYSQNYDLAEKNPTKLNSLKKSFLQVAKINKAFPIGGGLWLRLHPKDRIASHYTNWTFDSDTKRMPEYYAPEIGRKSNKVIIDINVDENANGVIYALGGTGGGLTCFMENGKLVYEYNMEIIERYTIEVPEKLSAGKHTIEIITSIEKLRAPAKVVINVDGKFAASGVVSQTVAVVFGTESFDVGTDLGSPVSMRYKKLAPFPFNGKINKLTVSML